MLVCCVTRARADLKTTSAFERVEREGAIVELKGKYTIRNDGANDVNLAGQALMLRFPGYVRVRNDDDPEQSTVTRALPRDWIVECFWSYVEGRYNGTNVCPSIDFVVSSNAVEVRFVNTLILCPGCTLRGDSSYTSFVLKHRAYFPIFDNGFEMLESMGVHDFFDAPPPPPPTRRTRVCFPREVDFSFKVSSYPSRFDESRRVSTASSRRRRAFGNGRLRRVLARLLRRAQSTIDRFRHVFSRHRRPLRLEDLPERELGQNSANTG